MKSLQPQDTRARACTHTYTHTLESFILCASTPLPRTHHILLVHYLTTEEMEMWPGNDASCAGSELHFVINLLFLPFLFFNPADNFTLVLWFMAEGLEVVWRLHSSSWLSCGCERTKRRRLGIILSNAAPAAAAAAAISLLHLDIFTPLL